MVYIHNAILLISNKKEIFSLYRTGIKLEHIIQSEIKQAMVMILFILAILSNQIHENGKSNRGYQWQGVRDKIKGYKSSVTWNE